MSSTQDFPCAENKSIPVRERLQFRLSLYLGALIFAAMTAAFFVLIYFTFEREIVIKTDALEGTAIVFSAPIGDALVNGDRNGVQRVLTSIGRFDQFKFASVLDSEGRVFAELGYQALLQRDDQNINSRSVFELLFHNDLWVEADIRKNGSVIGQLKLLSDISSIRTSFFTNLALTMAISFIIAAGTIILCMRSIGVITSPIHNLASFMQKIGDDENYAARAGIDGKGEVGALAKSFNVMLEGIESRNSALLDHQQTLEDKVLDRTQALSVAKNEAEAANAAKSEFLATMSHEIRTPMNGMLVMAELLASADLTPKHQRYADVVMKSGRSLLTIINDVLDFSKIESGKLEVEKLPVSVRSLTEDAMALFWQTASTKNLDISCQIDKGVPETISSDPVRLNQVLCNLINNAIKFTDSGYVYIHIQVDPENRDNLLIAVKDTGVGIHRDKLDHVFESFTQADQSTTRKYGGTGLGLPICKSLVTAMGGDIFVESELGQGATFFFSIPHESKSVASEPQKIHNKTALLALPISATFHVLKDALEQRGISVFTAQSVEELSGLPSHIDFLFAHTKDLESVTPHIKSTYQVALSALGEFDVEQKVQDGFVHELIMQPLSTFSTREVLENLINDCPRGKALLTNNATPKNTLASFKGCRVLVADDNAVNREVIMQALQRFDLEPDVVDNGLEALALFDDREYDFIFMDCSMPEMDGFQTTEIIREREQKNGLTRTPIIALTAHMADKVADQWQSAGMDDIVVKPFSMETLGNCLDTWLTPAASTIEPISELVVETNTQNIPAWQQSNQDSLFDTEALQNLREILGEHFDTSFNRLITLYWENAPILIDEIHKGFSRRDGKALSESAHALKSMTANVSATSLSDYCSEIEFAGQNGSFEQAAASLEALTILHERLLVEIAERLDQPSPQLKQPVASN